MKRLKKFDAEGQWFGTTYEPVEGEEIYSILMSELSLHDLANEHPKMTEKEYSRLKNSISEIGQQEPVTIYRKNIVDGRHRYWAMKALNIEEIKCKVIPHLTSIEDVREIVFGSEVRRHQSPTQKAIKAWYATQIEGLSHRDAEDKFMTSRNMISVCKYIAERRGSDILDKLYNGKQVAIGLRTSDKLTTVKKLIKEEEYVELEKKLNPRKNMSNDEIKDKAEKYINSLASEDREVIEYVVNRAYAMIKEKNG